MNIAILSAARYRKNGIATVIRNMYLNSVFEKENITFIFPTDSDDEMIGELIGKGFSVICLERKKRLKYYSSLKKVLNNGNFDLIHVHGNSFVSIIELLAAKRAGIKVRIMHAHNVSCSSNFLNRLFKPFLNRLCTERYACSSEAGRFLFSDRPYTVLNNSFNVEKYEFNQELRRVYREKYGLGNSIVIGHIGLFNEQKNHHFLIDVFNLYHSNNPESYLFLVGSDGPLYEKEKRYVEALGLKKFVVFAGTQGNVNELLNVFDVFVFPSVHEGLGIVALEAQANGLPVIASDCVPRMAKVNDNFNFLPLKLGADLWAETIDKISKKRIDGAVKRIKDAGFDLDDTVLTLYNSYNKLVDEK